MNERIGGKKARRRSFSVLPAWKQEQKMNRSPERTLRDADIKNKSEVIFTCQFVLQITTILTSKLTTTAATKTKVAKIHIRNTAGQSD